MSNHQAEQNRRGLRRVKQATVRTEKKPYDFRSPVRTPRLGGGGPATIFWTRLTGTISAATGTWGSQTAGSLTGQAIYRITGGVQVALPGTYTVYNGWPTTFPSAKTTSVFPNGDGTYSIGEQAC